MFEILKGVLPSALTGGLRNVRFTGQDWSSSLITVVFFGLLALGYYGLHSDVAKLTAILFLSAASLLVGVFLGFLFGIPRSLQGDNPAQAESKQISTNGADQKSEAQQPRFQYRANTNLEQISDWLTKILVGVGLTQLNNLPGFFVRAGDYFGAAIGEPETASRIAIAIILFFSICGFLLGYLWTRLFLGGELAKADFNAVVREFAQAQEEQSQIDAKALSLVNQFLVAQELAKFDVAAMKEAIKKASPLVKVQVFYLARTTRNSTWEDNKSFMERTIPIFEALIESDVERKFHRNFGQLGYALAEKIVPDYLEAEKNLNIAIRIRGSAEEFGFEFYEVVRAICRIGQDDNFKKNNPSAPEKQNIIMNDIDVGVAAGIRLEDFPKITEWLKINAPEKLLQ